MNLSVLEELEKVRDELRTFGDDLYQGGAALHGFADRIDAAIALLRGQSWQPIETCPKVSEQRMLLAWPDGTVEQGIWLKNSTWEGYRPESLRVWPRGKPTHWQPLPAPPKDPADEQ